MHLFKRSLLETARGLGVNLPTTLTLAVGIGLAVLLFFEPQVAVTEDASASSDWLVILMRVFAIAIVSVPLLIWNTIKIARQDRIIKERLVMESQSANERDIRMKNFLRNVLSNPWYGIAQCYAFGSVVAHYPSRDVDIIVQFDSSTERRVRTLRGRLRQVEQLFHEHHQTRLHPQFFLGNEDESLANFLVRAGNHERLL